MDIGYALREARERRGVTLEDVADATKLPKTTLDALEGNRLDELPGGIYPRAFLRAYAGELHLDASALIREYDHQCGAVEIAPEVNPGVQIPIEEPGSATTGFVAAILTMAVVSYAASTHMFSGQVDLPALPEAPALAIR